MSVRGAIATCLALLALSACSKNALRTSEVDVVEVRALEVAFQPGDRGDVEVELVVHNPGLPAGALTALQWEVWLGNRWFAAGTQALTEPLPSGGASTVKVSLPIVFHRLVPAPEAPRAIDFGLRGAVTVQAAGSTQRLPFQTRRTVTTKYAPVFTTPADEL